MMMTPEEKKSYPQLSETKLFFFFTLFALLFGVLAFFF